MICHPFSAASFLFLLCFLLLLANFAMPRFLQTEGLLVLRQLDYRVLLLVSVCDLKDVLHELAYVQISLRTRLEVCHLIAGC